MALVENCTNPSASEVFREGELIKERFLSVTGFM